MPESSARSATPERDSFDEKRSSQDGSFVKLKNPEDIELGSTVEREELLGNGTAPAVAQGKPTEPASSSAKAAIIWMVINTLATIGIVCGNLSECLEFEEVLTCAI